ncbi:hypothetical protein F753_04195 [Stutzerimonas chloritidismutans AW-1]|uniref:Uncharacterized protein n=1 Tax=Stutzerimonas chloritidismutans AW-1 TaxID=1263865 RepID=V4PWY0_STUCH|nr:hypothetical protein [Stutzerimonas chloritidismutans]ESR00706.1 hypothetical protein F753_04195 [Stutzerimonas chloritidismutans AW-1]
MAPFFVSAPVAGLAGAEATGWACTSAHTNNLVLYVSRETNRAGDQRLQALVELLELVAMATGRPAGAGRADPAGRFTRTE